MMVAHLDNVTDVEKTSELLYWEMLLIILVTLHII